MLHGDQPGKIKLNTPTKNSTTFVAFVQGEPILSVEDVEISLAAFAGS